MNKDEMVKFLNDICMAIEDVIEDIRYDLGTSDSVPESKLQQLLEQIEEKEDDLCE